jgi:TatD DNase family protein
VWVDTHAHLNDAAFATSVETVVAEAIAAGVERIVVVGIDLDSSRRAVELAQSFSPLFAAVGVQPNSLGTFNPADWDELVALLDAPKVVAVGETGLDRYWNVVPIEAQCEWFARHLELADAAKLPVIIHCRNAEADVVEALQSFGERIGRPIAGVMHSFTGDVETARACCELGLLISFAGMVTYKKNAGLRAVAAGVPLERLLIETDSPYLAPEPVRGQPNRPANLPHTGVALAAVKGLAVADFAAATTQNARSLFRL